MRIVFALAVLAASLLTAGPIVSDEARAAGPVACRQLNAGLTDSQRPRVDDWRRQQRPGGDFTIDHTCDVDGKRAIVAIADYNGLDSAVYLAEFGESGLRMRKLIDGAIESPVLFTLPGGARSLVYVTQRPDRGLLLRAFKSIDLAGGAPRILFEAHYDSRGGGCRASPGVPSVLVAIAARPSDANKDGHADLILDREIETCSTGRTERGELIFLATPDGFRPRP